MLHTTVKKYLNTILEHEYLQMIFCDVWRVDWKSMVRPLLLAIGLEHHLLKITKDLAIGQRHAN